MQRQILLVEDDQIHREMLEEALSDQGYRVLAAATGQEALDLLNAAAFDVALVDIRLPDLDGFQLLEQLLGSQPQCSVLLMTGQASIETAVSAMRQGAHDFLPKPFRMDLLLLKLERLFHLRDIEEENRQLRVAADGSSIVGKCLPWRRFLASVESVAPTDATVLLQGESGTGKELVADLLHSLSPRSRRPLIKVNCGAIPESLMESELFGYEKGAFTGAERARSGYLEQAHGGTLFLDEIGEIPHLMQVKLLRVLHDRKVQRLGGEKPVPTDFRLVAASHRNLEELRAAGGIRDDFFYRLNVIPLTLPPLRERRDDLPLLLEHFIRKYAGRYGKSPIRFAPESYALLQHYPFPGNVRELENLVERLQVLSAGTEILPRHLPAEFRRGEVNGASPVVVPLRTDLPLKEVVREFELRVIDQVLREEGGNRTAAARRLGISRKNLWERLERH